MHFFEELIILLNFFVFLPEESPPAETGGSSDEHDLLPTRAGISLLQGLIKNDTTIYLEVPLPLW